jgi:ribonuclease-3
MREPSPPPPAPRQSFWSWFKGLFSRPSEASRERVLGAQEQRVLTEFCRQYGLPFKDLALLKLALTHRSYLSVTGQGPRESNERLEFLGDSVLGLVTSEFLYRRHPDEHEGQLTKIKSLLVSKAILSRRALRIGLGRFVLMSHSEVESGGRQRLSILADAFESVIGAIYLDQGFEPARAFIQKHLLAESDAITSDKRHTNYKSHLQEYVQNSFRTHPVYRIRSEYGPDHSKHFMVEVMVGKRTLGEGRGHNKKEAEQAAARDALEKVERLRRKVREDEDRAAERSEERDASPRTGSTRRGTQARREPGPVARGAAAEPPPDEAGALPDDTDEGDETSDRVRRRRRSRRGGRLRHGERGSRGLPNEGSSAGDERPGSETEFDGPDAGSHNHVTSRSLADDFETGSVSPGEPDARFGDADETRDEAGERSPLVQWEERLPEPERESARPARAMRFGRGRRRDAVAAAGESRGRGEAQDASAEDRRVDVFAAPPSADVAPPAEVAAAAAPIVDVSAEEGGEVENERDREARIDEMERALESFGRRRTSDYGRRGRRR